MSSIFFVVPTSFFCNFRKKYATYYNCKFLGGTGSEQKVPYKSSYDYTTIPCDNYPGFVETKRMICPSDPKTNGTNQCKVVSSSS